MNAEVQSAIRSLVKIAGSALATYGVGVGSDWEAISGAVIVIGGFVWSIVVARKSKAVPNA